MHAGRHRLSSVSLATGYNQSVADCSTACFHFAAYTKYVLRYENSRSAVYGNRLETARTDRCACFYLWYSDSDFLQGSIYAAIWCCLLYHCCNCHPAAMERISSVWKLAGRTRLGKTDMALLSPTHHHLPARQAVGFCECRHYIGWHIHLITQRRCSCKQTDAVPVNGENVFRIKNVKFQKKC